MRILEVLAASDDNVSLKEIAARVNMVKSSAFRILYSLEKLGYVEHAEGNGTYRMTWKTVGLARRSAGRATLSNIARPHLTRLRDELWESAWLAEWRENKALLVDVVEAPQQLQLSLEVGSECPLHATAAGKCIGAHLPKTLLKAALGGGKLPKYTAHTISSRSQLLEEFEKVRRQGFAINEEETIEGAVLVGAPLFDCTQQVIASISVSALTARWSTEKSQKTISAVIRTAVAITADLTNLGFQSTRNGRAARRPI
jgi:DNA-binding IclR family transcriptional regulator